MIQYTYVEYIVHLTQKDDTDLTYTMYIAWESKNKL